jgi:hypothetical protein
MRDKTPAPTARPPRFEGAPPPAAAPPREQFVPSPKRRYVKDDYHTLPRHQHGYGGGSPRSPQVKR